MKKMLIAMFLLVPALYACEKQGPLERAGEEVDEAIGDVKAGHETTGHKIDDAVDDLKKGARKAGDELK